LLSSDSGVLGLNMSFDHKAYEFDWQAFSAEMLPWLSGVLAANDSKRLTAFVDANIVACRSPYDEQHLSRSWQEMLEVGDAQEIADFALTKYYNPALDHGVGDVWAEMEDELPASLKIALLGQSIPHFDPGRQGSYFSTPSDAEKNATLLTHMEVQALSEYGNFLARASGNGFGVYVTF
jgi:hypothetical protein